MCSGLIFRYKIYTHLFSNFTNTAKTEPTMDLTKESLYKSIFSPDEDINPAFHDFAHSRHSFTSHFSY